MVRGGVIRATRGGIGIGASAITPIIIGGATAGDLPGVGIIPIGGGRATIRHTMAAADLRTTDPYTAAEPRIVSSLSATPRTLRPRRARTTAIASRLAERSMVRASWVVSPHRVARP